MQPVLVSAEPLYILRNVLKNEMGTYGDIEVIYVNELVQLCIDATRYEGMGHSRCTALKQVERHWQQANDTK